MQVFLSDCTTALSTTLTQYLGPIPGRCEVSSATGFMAVLVRAGTADNLRLELDVAPGSGKSRTFTLFKNGVATAMAFTISDLATSGEDTANSVSYADGDTLELRSQVSGTPAAATPVAISLEWTPTTTDESIYVQHQNNNLVGSGTLYRPLFGGSRNATPDVAFSVAAIAGTITHYRILLNGNPGGVAGWTFNIVKNGVVQDGTGGTVDTSLTIIGATNTGNETFSLPMAVGDRFEIQSVSTGSPAGWSMLHVCSVVASTSGEFMIPATDASTMSNSATSYNYPTTRTTLVTWNATQANRQIKWLSSADVRFTVLAARLSSTPGSGKSYTIGLGVNGTYFEDTVADADRDALASGSVTPTSGDLISIRSTPAGTPTAGYANYTIGLGLLPDPKVGCAVFGVKTTIKATRAIAFGLDDAVNIHDEAGKFKVFGKGEYTEALTVIDPVDDTDAVTKQYCDGNVGSVADDSITNAKLTNMAQATIKGRAAGAGTGDPVDLTADQASTILDTATDPFVRTSDLGGGTGDVVGPASAVDQRVAVFDGITGKLIEDGGSTIADIIAAGGTTTTAAHASRPAAGNAGDLFLPSDGFYLDRDSGSVWQSWGPLFPMVPPVDSDFAWINQGSATVSATRGGVHLATPAASGENVKLRKKAAPATPYTITAAFLPLVIPPTGVFPSMGLMFRQSSDGKVAGFVMGFNTSWAFRVYHWTSPTVFSAAAFTGAAAAYPTGLIWLRIGDDGVNKTYSFSTDGQNFALLFSHGRTTFLTADEVGFFVNAGSAANGVAMTLLHWKEA